VERVTGSTSKPGADIIETNTFSATAISQADFGLEAFAYEMNLEAARIARKAVNAFVTPATGPRFVAGALGPTNRTASLAIDVNHPGQADALPSRISGRPITTRLAASSTAASISCWSKRSSTRWWGRRRSSPSSRSSRSGRLRAAHAVGHDRRPVGRTLSGQTVEAFWNSTSNVPLFSVGINCSLGPKEMRPYIEELSRVAPLR
jgi:5-methyltetrahydrofolate--homocysteine methyltransferase